MTEAKNFLGIPISGEIYLGRTRKEQKSATDFQEEFLNPFLAEPRLLGVCWEQYTPYFNDGDTCEFGVYGKGIKLLGAEDHNPEDTYGLPDSPTGWVSTESLGYWPPADSTYETSADLILLDSFFGHKEYESDAYVGTDEQKNFSAGVKKWINVLDSSYYELLLRAFGDHALVRLEKTADGTNIIVERVEHD